jgi:hypothetical protein
MLAECYLAGQLEEVPKWRVLILRLSQFKNITNLGNPPIKCRKPFNYNVHNI